MLRKAKTKSEPEAPPEPSLADRIKATCAEAEVLIQAKVDELKASPEGRLLPRDWLAMNLRAVNRSGGCSCKLALALLEEKNGQ